MIKDHLPERKFKKSELHLIQGLVPKEIVDEVVRIKKETGWTWDAILTAYCKDFIKEFQKKE